MTQRTLIVARMAPADATTVASIFRHSDAGALPDLIGVVHRSLYQFAPDLYFHYIEADTDIATAVDDTRTHPLFIEVNAALERHIAPFDATTWRSPRDAMAKRFYTWDRPAGRSLVRRFGAGSA
jgi:cyclase